MTSKLTQLSEQKSAAELQTLSRESVRWLKNKISDLKNPSKIRVDISREQERYRNKNRLGYNTEFLLGGLYFFYYNPKTKDDLPYYDIFPLVIPLQKLPDGFLGLNLHYLPPKWRITFLSKLTSRAIYDANDEIKRLRVTYEILDTTRRFREFRPCVKKYLNSHVRSKILAVNPNEWDVACMLPVQQFRKAPVTEVWSDSLNQIRNN